MSFYSVHQSYFICAFSYFTNYGTFWMFRSKSTMNLTRFYMTRFYLTPCAGTPSRPVSYPASRLQNESPTAELRQPVHRKSFGFNRWENTFTFWYHNLFCDDTLTGISAVSCFMLRWEGVGIANVPTVGRTGISSQLLSKMQNTEKRRAVFETFLEITSNNNWHKLLNSLHLIGREQSFNRIVAVVTNWRRWTWIQMTSLGSKAENAICETIS